jgi:hypothetical protein
MGRQGRHIEFWCFFLGKSLHERPGRRKEDIIMMILREMDCEDER